MIYSLKYAISLKFYQVAEALKTITPNQLSSWYNREILNKSEEVK